MKAIENQTLMDVAIAQLGRVDQVVELAIENGMDVTGDLWPGQDITIPNNVALDADVIRYFNSRNHNPATALPVLIAEETDYFPAFPGMLDLMLS